MSDTPTRQIPAIVVPTPPALDDHEKVGQVMSPPASSTGTPRVKPNAVPWVLGLLVGINAGLALCAAKAPDPNVRLGCEFGAATMAGILGTISPGLRKKP